MIFLNEFRKIYRKKTFLVLFCVIILNGALIYVNEKDRGYPFSAKDYRDLYAMDEMKGEADSQLSYLNSLIDGGISSRYLIALFVRSDIEKASGYEDYLNKIAETSEKYEKISSFRSEDEFAGRNIRKIAQIYSQLPEIRTTVGKSRGVVMASEYRYSVILEFFFVIYVVILLVVREKEIGTLGLTMSTKLGRFYHGTSKLMMCLSGSVLAAITLEIENWMIASFTYGLGDMNRSIQSIPEYQSCVFNISVLGFMIIMICFRAFCAFVVAVTVFFVACRRRSIIGFIVEFAVLFGAEAVLFFFVPNGSVWVLFKYINIFAGLDSYELIGNYMNLNLFGYPIWYLPVLSSFMLLIILSLSFFGIRGYGNMELYPSKIKFRFFRMNSNTCSVFLHECYRYFVYERVFVIVFLLFILRGALFAPEKESFESQDDVYFKQYMLKLEGMYSPDKQKEIDAEEVLYAEIKEKADAAIAVAVDDEIRGLIQNKYMEETACFKVLYKVREHAEYLKENGGAFFYDRGYRILEGDYGGKEQNMLLNLTAGFMMVICSIFMYGHEYQTGADRLIRSTRRGRRYLLFRREVIGTLVLAVIFIIIYLPFTLSVIEAYGSQGMDFPACSICSLSWCPHWVTVRGYFIGLNIVRFMFLWIGMNLQWYISVKLRSVSSTLFIGMGLSTTAVLVLF